MPFNSNNQFDLFLWSPAHLTVPSSLIYSLLSVPMPVQLQIAAFGLQCSVLVNGSSPAIHSHVRVVKAYLTYPTMLLVPNKAPYTLTYPGISAWYGCNGLQNAIPSMRPI
jgi:hypothetical protein